MEGKTIKEIQEGGEYTEELPHLNPSEDAELIRNSHWLSVVDGKVYSRLNADHLIIFTDGTRAAITSCGCCGGAHLEECL